MKSFCIKTSFFIAITYLVLQSAFAVQLELIAPERATNTSDPVFVRVVLDPENDTVSGISGDISFPAELFDLHSISTTNSVVSPWVVYPSLQEEEYLDGRMHITFEGVFAGGFGGVRSAYYNGAKTGDIFTLILLPKQKGAGVITLDSLTVNAFNENATPLPVIPKYHSIVVPQLISNPILPGKVTKKVEPKNLKVSLERSELVHQGKWFVTVYDEEPKSAIESVHAVETTIANDAEIPLDAWKKITPPHIIFHQDRSKFIHVKVIYSNGAYAIKTISPVENLHASTLFSRILNSVIILSLLYVMFIYITHHVRFFSKKSFKNNSKSNS